MPSTKEHQEYDIEMYSPEDIQNIFKLSRAKTYALINSDGFPKIKINKKIIVPKHLLLEWIKKQAGREYNY